MVTNKVKCPECGAIMKTHGIKTFVCCGTRWKIEDCLLTSKENQSEIENLEDTPEEDKEGKAMEEEGEGIDLNEEEKGEKKLPERRKKRKEDKDNLICPFCAGDVYATRRKGIFYCHACDRYLVEED